MNELHAVTFFEGSILEFLAVHEASVDLNDDGRIIFLGSVEKFLDGEVASLKFFREAVK
jgi:hypothetical protein